MYKVSVVMPVYNAGEYLRNALDSVVNQSMGFENIELILVDDKSTDDSRSIIEEYSSKYSNIKQIFLEENSGCPGIPRNIGIRNATSDYIMFIDSDDEYLSEICDKLYNTIITEDADIVVCNYLDAIGDNDVKYSCFSDEVVIGSEIIYFCMSLVWNCIFKRSIILDNDISFIDGINEDTLFTLEYYMYSHKLVYLKDFIGLRHRLREGSLSVISFDILIDTIKAFYLMVKLLELGGVEDSNRFFKNKIQWCIANGTILRDKTEIKGVLSALHDFEKKINFTGDLPILFRFINFFILHGSLNIATYICLFIGLFSAKVRKSNLLLSVYRKFFLKSV